MSATEWCKKCGVELDGLAFSMTCLECHPVFKIKYGTSDSSTGTWGMSYDTQTILKDGGWTTYTASSHT